MTQMSMELKLLIPSYTKGKDQLSKKAVGESRRLALVWVHVEQVITKLSKEVHYPTSISYIYVWNIPRAGEYMGNIHQTETEAEG